MPRARRFHEDLGRKHEVKGSSDRAFGVTVGGIILLIGVIRSVLGYGVGIELLLIIIGVSLIALGLTASRILAPLNKAWTKLGHFLFKVINPLVMGLIFFIAVAPTGLIMRLSGKDILRLNFDPLAKTYWIDRRPRGPAPDTMKNQF